MREVERYRRDIVMHNSMHSLGSGDSLLGRGWTLFHSGDALGERQWARVDILLSPVGCCHRGQQDNTLGVFLVNKRVCSLRVWVGERVLTVVCEYPDFLEVLGEVLKGTPPKTLSSFKTGGCVCLMLSSLLFTRCS